VCQNPGRWEERDPAGYGTATQRPTDRHERRDRARARGATIWRRLVVAWLAGEGEFCAALDGPTDRELRLLVLDVSRGVAGVATLDPAEELLVRATLLFACDPRPYPKLGGDPAPPTRETSDPGVDH
jgi:hypothetical protein